MTAQVGWMSNESMLPFADGPIAAATYLLANETYSGAAGALGRLTSATLDFYGGASGGGKASYTASYDALGRLASANDTYTPSGGIREPALPGAADLRRALQRHRERHHAAAGDRHAGLLLRRPLAAGLGRVEWHTSV